MFFLSEEIDGSIVCSYPPDVDGERMLRKFIEQETKRLNGVDAFTAARKSLEHIELGKTTYRGILLSEFDRWWPTVLGEI